MSAISLFSKDKLSGFGDRPADSQADAHSEKARDRFAPIDQLLSRIGKSEELQACA